MQLTASLVTPQTKAARYRGATDKAGKDAYHDAMQLQSDLFDQAKANGVDPKVVGRGTGVLEAGHCPGRCPRRIAADRARPQATNRGALRQATTRGSNQPQSAIEARLNKTYNEGTLETALGNQNAKDLMAHVGEAAQRIDEIQAKAVTTKATQKKVAGAAKYLGGAIGVGGGAATVARVFSGKHEK
jgi:hypothetical protein